MKSKCVCRLRPANCRHLLLYTEADMRKEPRVAVRSLWCVSIVRCSNPGNTRVYLAIARYNFPDQKVNRDVCNHLQRRGCKMLVILMFSSFNPAQTRVWGLLSSRPFFSLGKTAKRVPLNFARTVLLEYFWLSAQLARGLHKTCYCDSIRHVLLHYLAWNVNECHTT